MKSVLANLSSLLRYSVLVSKKWVFWLFVLLDIIALLAQYVDSALRLPQIVYILLALLGFLWAGFDVHRETMASYEELQSETTSTHAEQMREYREALEIWTGKSDLGELDLTPKLATSLTEGNEYEYSLMAPMKPQMGILMLIAEVGLKLFPKEGEQSEDIALTHSQVKDWIKEGQLEYHASRNVSMI